MISKSLSPSTFAVASSWARARFFDSYVHDYAKNSNSVLNLSTAAKARAYFSASSKTGSHYEKLISVNDDLNCEWYQPELYEKDLAALIESYSGWLAGVNCVTQRVRRARRNKRIRIASRSKMNRAPVRRRADHSETEEHIPSSEPDPNTYCTTESMTIMNDVAKVLNDLRRKHNLSLRSLFEYVNLANKISQPLNSDV